MRGRIATCEHSLGLKVVVAVGILRGLRKSEAPSEDVREGKVGLDERGLGLHVSRSREDCSLFRKDTAIPDGFFLRINGDAFECRGSLL